MNHRKREWRLGFVALSLIGTVACSSQSPRSGAATLTAGRSGAVSDSGAAASGGTMASAQAGTGTAAIGGGAGRASEFAGSLASDGSGSGSGGAIAQGSAGIGGHGTSAPSTGDGSCDPGTTTTTWASNCATSLATTCTAGTWTAVGSTTNDPLVLESAHFAVYAPTGTVTNTQAQAALDVLEKTVWPTFMGPPIFFPEPYCNSADKHKVSIVIHSDYGLTGGGWGTGNLGMWIGPGATADHWGLAHEFTHALQTSTGGLASSQYTGWIWESHANWHAHQLSEYHNTNVHCSEMLPNFPHLYLGSTRDRYCNWQFMEYLKDKYCYAAVEQMWAKAPKSGAAQSGADPFSVIQSNMGWTVSQLNDFFGEWAMHNVTWDYRNPDGSDEGALYRKNYGATSDVAGNAPGAPAGFRRLRLTQLEPLTTDADSRYVTPALWAPQRWGYNVVRLQRSAGASNVKVTFRGVMQSQAASTTFGKYPNQPDMVGDAHSDWRWGLVAVDSTGAKPRYSAMQHGADAELNFCVGDSDAELYLVVMATPSAMQQIEWDQMYYTIYRYPWMVQLDGAVPDGLQPNAPSPIANANAKKWANGGGWVSSTAKVDSTVYVGPYAAVIGGTVSGNARIDEHAVIVSGNISGMATVKGMSVVSGVSANGSAVISTVFQGPGSFEPGQTISGTGQIWGDIELRDQGTNVASGVYYGFVDGAALTANPSQGGDRKAPSPEVTTPPPYAWRP